MEEAIARMKKKLDRDILTYTGNDPLKLKYDFLVWLEETYGKDKCPQEFNNVLEDTLNCCWNEARYRNDDRFIQLLIFYSEFQKAPLELFSTSFKKGIGLNSSQFYASWANEFCKIGDYHEADRIINLGFSNNAAPKEILENLYQQFLQTMGKNYLLGKLGNPNTSRLLCSRCSEPIQEKEPEVQNKPAPKQIVDPVQCWEMNPLKVGEPDTFKCPVVYMEPENPLVVSMYPKKEVYAEEGKEYSLEELAARKYFKKIAEENERKLVEDVVDANSDSRLAKGNESIPFFGDKKERSTTHSYGDYTKEAMDVIQEMWNSPGLATVERFKEPPLKKVPFEVFDENTPIRLPKKSKPFTVYTEESLSQNTAPEVEEKPSVKKLALPKPNLLSERKVEPPPIERPSMPRKLPFQSMYANGALAEKLSQASIDNKPPGIPLDDEDTCNTKAFAFCLPSSTPVHEKKAAAQNLPSHNGSYNEDVEEKPERKTAPTQQDLSVILEASKERFSSSSSSNASSNPRTPGMISRPDSFLQNPFSWAVYNDLFGTETITFDYLPLIFPEHSCHMLDFYDILRKTNDWGDELEDNFKPKSVLCEADPNDSLLRPPPQVTKNRKSSRIRLSDITNRSQKKASLPRKKFKSMSSFYPSSNETGNIRDLKTRKSHNSFKTCCDLENVIVEQHESPARKKKYSNIEVNFDGKRPLYFETVDDPFCKKLNDWFLTQMNFPHESPGESQYCEIKSNITNISKYLKIGDETFNIVNEIGKGSYARVMRAKWKNKDYALKIEKPACKWEFYIAKEIQRRVDPRMKCAFGDIMGAYIFQNGSILQMEWAPYGTILSLISDYRTKTGKALSRDVILHFSIEIIDIVDTLHKAKIIHGDIKPDNFILKCLPNENETKSCIQLIDFGRSIDMTLFREGTQFLHVVTTDGFQCNEMKENKPWTYQTDLYGLAGTLHCLLVGNYMKVVKKDEKWKLLRLLPRNIKRELWEPILMALLNIKSSDCLPDLSEMKSVLQKELDTLENRNVLSSNFRHLSNVLKGC